MRAARSRPALRGQRGQDARDRGGGGRRTGAGNHAPPSRKQRSSRCRSGRGGSRATPRVEDEGGWAPDRRHVAGRAASANLLEEEGENGHGGRGHRDKKWPATT